ncbi:phospho-acceptor domain-containing protein [Algoriphagus yeomjeoni]|uniref:histidine kinase n=1 Tax=Algoriphagus yeomjeoni TaxID=291403 RepID=A0A327PJ40_9BACT|nr:phospho-acceptor domain-containing protein [Algoriphagus yeomjeoni]
MTLDYPSILFFLALNNLFIIALYIYQYFFHHKQWYLLLVALGIGFQVFAIVIFNFREAFPPLLPIRISNFLMIFSFPLISFGLLSFDGIIRKKLLWAFTAIAFLVFFGSLIVEENNTMLNVIRISSSSIFFGIGSYYLFTNTHKYKSAILISGVLLIYSIFQLIRAFNIYQLGQTYIYTTNSLVGNWFLIISLFVISGSCIGFIMLLKEIDQKTILEKNIIIEHSKLKLEELNQTQNKLFSIIAHDLRNPFNNIVGLSELLKESDTDKGQAIEYADLINSTAKNTLNLLDNLLNWAKSQTGELSFTPSKIKLTKVISEIIWLKESLAKAKHISLTYSPTRDIELYTDRNILDTILRNLISNAIKFTKQGGYIIVLATADEHQVQISICDNGVGMNQETIRKIFDPSSTMTSLGTENEGGSGLGLVLCREFVKRLNGHLWVESVVGKGSKFIFTLPLTSGAMG